MLHVSDDFVQLSGVGDLLLQEPSLFLGDADGDRLAFHLTRPFVVRTVQLGRLPRSPPSCPSSSNRSTPYLYAFLEEAHALIQQFPSLVDAVETDLDAYGLRKKVIRVSDAEWLANRTLHLPDMPEPAQEPDKPLVLCQGRPRTSGYVVLIALLLRDYWGAGFKSVDATCAMAESITLRVFFTNLGVKMPGRSTLTEFVNAVSNETQ